MKRRLTVLVAALAVLLAACGSSGAPESFEDQPGPLPEEIAPFASDFGVSNPEAVPLVQRNFLEGCMLDGTLRLEGLSGAALARACGCSYDGLVTFLLDNQTVERPAFETFKEIDDDLGVEGAAVANQYLEIFDECRRGA